METNIPDPPLFDDSPDELERNVSQYITEKKKKMEEIVRNVKPHEVTFKNVLTPLIDLRNKNIPLLGRVELYVIAAPDEQLRESARKASKLLAEPEDQSDVERGYFILLESLMKKRKMKEFFLSAEDGRLLVMTHQMYLHEGAHLASEKQKELKVIMKRQTDIVSEFKENITKDNGEIYLTKEQLDSVEDRVQGFLGRLQFIEQTKEYRLTHKSDHRLPVLRFAKDPKARNQMYIAHQNAAPKNVPLFQEMLVLRLQAAKLLDKPNHATIRLEDTLLTSPKEVETFLTQLSEKLKPGRDCEVKDLKEMKKKDLKAQRKPLDDDFYRSEYPYYKQMMQEELFAVDPILSEYFPLDHVLEKMLDTAKDLFGLDFFEIKGSDRDAIAPGKASLLVWHPDVRMFRVCNPADEGGEFLGYLYFDLHARDGKHRHGMDLDMQESYESSDPTIGRGYAVSALLMDFATPTPETPALLSHSEVMVLFHEIGHALHNLVSRTKYACAVLDDFSEVTSQMLEYWCWDLTFLQNIARHYTDCKTTGFQEAHKEAYEDSHPNDLGKLPPAKLSKSLIQQLIRSDGAAKASEVGRQVHWSQFDQLIHTIDSEEDLRQLDLKERFNKGFQTFQPFVGSKKNIDGKECEVWDWGHEFATYGHLIAGSDATYYKYPYGRMLAADLYTMFPTDAVERRRAGRRFRKDVLNHGWSKDPNELMHTFLGREPNSTSYFREMEQAVRLRDK